MPVRYPASGTCKRGHDLATVGVYFYERPTGERSSVCCLCRKESDRTRKRVLRQGHAMPPAQPGRDMPLLVVARILELRAEAETAPHWLAADLRAQADSLAAEYQQDSG